MKNIIYTRPIGALDMLDRGGVTIIYPTEDLPEEEMLTAHSRWIPEWAQDVRVVDESELPTDRHFRNAWKCEGGLITTCIDRAREITKERLRREREPLFKDLDVQFYKALEAEKETAAIVAEKDRLRDITKLVDLESSLDVLKSMKASKE